MLRLKDRQRQIPGGFRFYLPEAKWSAPGNFPSFSVVTALLQGVIKANPALADKHHWPTETPEIEAWVDTFNATVCAKMGWNDFILGEPGGASTPKTLPPLPRASLAAAAARAKELVAGAQTLIEWIDSGDPPVPAEQASARAAVCAACPKNETGDFTRWFTKPAAELIKRQLEKSAVRNLLTPSDPLLNLCTACHCPLKLKVHVPIDWITKRLSAEQRAKLSEAPHCWILAESP